jgi:hypothetical protein
LPVGASATTTNRLCGSVMDAVITAARAIKSGETEFAPRKSRHIVYPRILQPSGITWLRRNAAKTNR